MFTHNNSVSQAPMLPRFDIHNRTRTFHRHATRVADKASKAALIKASSVVSQTSEAVRIQLNEISDDKQSNQQSTAQKAGKIAQAAFKGAWNGFRQPNAGDKQVYDWDGQKMGAKVPGMAVAEMKALGAKVPDMLPRARPKYEDDGWPIEIGWEWVAEGGEMRKPVPKREPAVVEDVLREKVEDVGHKEVEDEHGDLEEGHSDKKEVGMISGYELGNETEDADLGELAELDLDRSQLSDIEEKYEDEDEDEDDDEYHDGDEDEDAQRKPDELYEDDEDFVDDDDDGEEAETQDQSRGTSYEDEEFENTSLRSGQHGELEQDSPSDEADSSDGAYSSDENEKELRASDKRCLGRV